MNGYWPVGSIVEPIEEVWIEHNVGHLYDRLKGKKLVVIKKKGYEMPVVQYPDCKSDVDYASKTYFRLASLIEYEEINGF